MSERRAVFVDVDGTLVGHDGRIPPSATDAVRAARANGHLVLLCTGRTPASLWPAVDAVGFDGAVAASGAWVTLGGTTNAPETVLVQRSVSPDVLAEVRAFFDEHDTDVLLDGVDAIHGSPRVRERLLRVVGTGADPDGPFGFVERIRTDGALPEPIVKVEFIGCPLPLDAVRDRFAATFHLVPSSVDAFGSSSGEMSPVGVHKAAGMAAIVDHLGLDPASTIALGDSHNDLEVLQAAGIGIAMGNAPAVVQAVADEVTGHVDADGLAEAFARHGLLG